MSDTTTATLRRVQVRTTAVAMATVVLVLVVAAVGLASRFEQELLRQIDSQMGDAAAFVDRVMSEGQRFPTGSSDNAFAQVLDDAGTVVFATPPLDGQPPLIDPDSPGASTPHTVEADGVGPLRVMAVATPRGLTIVLATPLEPVELAVSSLVRTLAVGLPLLTVALGVVVWVVVGRTMRPVRAAVRREERLVADASHELRSPLAGVRALLESEPDDLDAVRASRADALSTLARLEAIADDLLIMARAERGEPGAAGRRRPVDLDEVVLDRTAVAARAGAPSIDTSAVSGGQVLGSERDLERLVDNLLTNARRHARSAVAVAVDEDEDGWVTLRVDDDGPGVPEPDRERVFERFTRLDDARTRDRGGAGLGLSIVRAVARDHGGSVAVGTASIGGASFTVRLPASVTPAAISSRS